ncbi:hypothetical protein RHGRI_002092 [Rhododendron griersonianum]|uniref:Protein kinase domain-containing protein n=1 Tax=Rhododendron griersonianum TaxID=479676 RepID=A0AAV6LNV7_9ERIC|nr:hypothetical protein RHGRI_002092 [Rhododendron griersonianum]KAG5566390.1 hypothetical protein RHGRI_002092 [Rhododendron griersonianum]KAG5566391.1 hypothetical protein RHGRI_002092 [Rhododendron griersonianum]
MGVPPSILALLLLFHLLFLHHSSGKCPESFDCGTHGQIRFPLSNSTYPHCGLYNVTNCIDPVPKLNLGKEGLYYDLIRFCNLTLVLGTVIPGVLILLLCLVIIIWRRNKWNHVSSYISSKNSSSDHLSKADLEGGSAYFGASVFSYAELEQATDDFDPSKELGDGGILRDGREVAVKRLYEHNYKRVKQFMNEIEILTCLSHPNLVTLFGCTSRHSRELLLVYEYIPNGTVADHLHGDRAKDGSLAWPIRMNIAIETASALAYLHDSDIIHRDVKTDNILLDNDFCVKVGDFGLSRLFPNHATHVSTAPQGTPGYVDPEYHRCYQLTDKSDVYSFGVVLIELISSLPAVDINRNLDDINLANLAVNRIQNRLIHELIDPSLGYESDPSIERMTLSVAEVAFRCLQLDKDMRPTMEEILEALIEIQAHKDENAGKIIDDGSALTTRRPPTSPDGEDDVLLKNSMAPFSPASVTNRWVSTSTAPTSSE